MAFACCNADSLDDPGLCCIIVVFAYLIRALNACSLSADDARILADILRQWLSVHKLAFGNGEETMKIHVCLLHFYSFWGLIGGDFSTSPNNWCLLSSAPLQIQYSHGIQMLRHACDFLTTEGNFFSASTSGNESEYRIMKSLCARGNTRGTIVTVVER